MSFLENIQNLPESSRKRIALGTALVLTVVIIGGSFTVSSLLAEEKVEEQKEESGVHMEFYEAGKDAANDVLYYVGIGWGDITSKVFSF